MIYDAYGNEVEVDPIPERPPVDEIEQRYTELARKLIDAEWERDGRVRVVL